jgi:hypothetical protein
MAGGVNFKNVPNAQPGWGTDNPMGRAFKSMPGDLLQDEWLDPTQNPSAYGWMMPRNATDVQMIDGRLVPFDAQGKQLQFERRPNVLPFYHDRSTGAVEMAVPGILDLVGDQSGIGSAYTGATAANMARRASRGQYGDDTLSNAAAMDDVPWNPPEGEAVETWGLLGHNGGPSLDPLASVDLPAGSDPRYRGKAPNRTTEYQRYIPREVPPRMQRLIAAADDPNHPINAVFDADVERGKTLKGEDWYNTEEMRDWFVGELGEEAGDARWREFVKLIGATSTGSDVASNFRNATFYNALDPEARVRVAERVAQGGITPAAAARELGLEPANTPTNYNYGHVMQGNHAKNVLAQARGEWEQQMPEGLTRGQQSAWLKANPKVKGFSNDLLGSEDNIAADKHFMRRLAMADGGVDFLGAQAKISGANLEELRAIYGDTLEPYIKTRTTGTGALVTETNLAKAVKDGVITDTEAFRNMPTAWLDTPDDTEYAALEQMAQRLARRHNMTPAQFQASLWMGAGDLTGLDDASQGTAMALFRRTLDKRASERGLTRKDMLREFIVNRAPLATLPPGLLDTGMSEEEQ